MNFFSINNTFFEVLSYQMSYIEFFGTITGAIAVWLSAKANVWSWPIGIISVILLMFLFYQVQLYPDMFLQIFFFVTNIMGWWRWTCRRNAAMTPTTRWRAPRSDRSAWRSTRSRTWRPCSKAWLTVERGMAAQFPEGATSSKAASSESPPRTTRASRPVAS